MWRFLSALINPFVAWRDRRRTDKPRETILREMLKKPPAGKKWSAPMEKLSQAIVADEAETAASCSRSERGGLPATEMSGH